MIFLTLLIFPVLIALGFKLFGNDRHKVTLKEFLVQMAIQIFIAGISVLIVTYSNTHDVETWNGRISKKEKVSVSCSHSYSCHCHQSCSGTGKSRSCRRVCSTCYEHSRDYSWRIYTSNDETIRIDRVDRQGVNTPPRWAKANVGDPTAVQHSYTNYIKAAPDSLFAMHGLVEEFKGSLPTYPSKIYDYHYIDRTVGNFKDDKHWNNLLMELNADVGARKEANIIIVNTPRKDARFFDALKQYWLGGKKNDIIVVVHVEHGKIGWARAMAWADDDIVKIKIRDALIGKSFTPEIVLPIIKENVNKHYKRKPMHDFEYLESSTKPSTTQWVVSMLIGCLASIAFGWFFWKNDAFNEETPWKRRYHPW